MAQDSFSADVDAWVAQTQRRMDTVFKESAQDVISEMQEVGPSVANPDSHGIGNMPVDTGYLRASIQAGLNDIPTAAIFRNPDPKKKVAYDPEAVSLTINGAQPGDTVYATYGAEYAPAMEARYGFVRLAAQNWKAIVAKRARMVRARVESALAAARARR